MSARRRGVGDPLALSQFALGQDVGGAFRELFAGLGQRQPPRCAVEQSNAKPGFQPAAELQLSKATALPKDCICSTLAKIAKPSRSGSFDMAPSETKSLARFYF
jgi:hypothetical protein